MPPAVPVRSCHRTTHLDVLERAATTDGGRRRPRLRTARLVAPSSVMILECAMIRLRSWPGRGWQRCTPIDEAVTMRPPPTKPSNRLCAPGRAAPSSLRSCTKRLTPRTLPIGRLGVDEQLVPRDAGVVHEDVELAAVPEQHRRQEHPDSRRGRRRGRTPRRSTR